MKGSPITTWLGSGGLAWLIADALKLLLDGDAATNPDWNVVVPALLASLTGVFAKDANASHAPAPKRKATKVSASGLLLLMMCPWLLTGMTGCAGMEIGDINAKVCKDDVCIGFTIPGQKYGVANKVKASGKEVKPVQ